MLKRTVLTITLSIILQFSSGSSETISEKDAITFEDLSQQLIAVIQNQLVNINEAKRNIKSIVDGPRKSLEVEMHQLRQYIQETTNQAKEENRDISKCVQEENLDSISFYQLDLCEQKHLIEYTEDVLKYLSNKHDTFLNDIAQCTEEHCRYSKKCELKSAIKKADIVIPSLIKNAYSSVVRCTQIGLLRIDQSITSLARSFTTCTDEIMEYI